MNLYWYIKKFLDKYVRGKSKYVVIERDKFDRLVSEYEYTSNALKSYISSNIKLNAVIDIKDLQIKELENELLEAKKKKCKCNTKCTSLKEEPDKDYTIIQRKNKHGEPIYYRQMLSNGKLSRVSKEEAVFFFSKYNKDKGAN